MIRDKDYIRSKLVTKDGRVYTTEKTIIEFPKWYADKELAVIKDSAYIYGVFSIHMGDKYSVSIIPTLIHTTPIMINEVDRDGVVYTQFIYGKNDCIINNIKAIKHELLSYNFIETFYMYANVPWFVEYEDLVRIMDNLPLYAKSGVGANFIVNEIITSFITRVSADKKVFYRQNLSSKKYSYVDLMNVYYSALNTTNRLSGNYFQESLVSAIVQKEKTTTKLEDLVRV